MPSLHPLTHVVNQIQSPNVKAAFLRAIGDDRSPNQIVGKELDRFLRAATDNDRRVRGHDLTPLELADLQMIRREAVMAFTAADLRVFDRKLATYEKKPQLEVGDTDPRLDVKLVAVNKVAIKGTAEGEMCPRGVVCIMGGPTTVSINVNGQRFAVQPAHGERASAVAKRLETELDAAGYRASVRTEGGRSILTVSGQAPLPVRNMTTDRAVNCEVVGSTVSFAVGYGGPVRFAGGQIGLEVKGQQFVERTTRQMEVGAAFGRLRRQLEAAGYEVQVASPPAIDSFIQAWTIRPAQRQTFEPGATAELVGRVAGAQPEDRALVLPQRIQVGDHLVDRVALPGNVERGESVRLSGRLDLVPANAPANERHVALTGVSNLSAGEPRHVDGKFYDDAGKELERLSYDRPMMYDAPATIFVLDQGHDRAFVGASGGMLPPGMNPFHGFRGVRPIRDATRTDIGDVRFRLPSDTPGGGRAAEEWPHNRAGEALTEISHTGERLGRRWFYDADSEKAYCFDVTGPTERLMLQVIAKDPRDV